ncbi:MAG: hypothetical protein WA303_06555 [Bradyrhizobium sp.]
MLAVDLEAVADFLRALTEKLRAFRTFDFDFFIDHGIGPKNISCFPELNGLLIYRAKYSGRLFPSPKFSRRFKATSEATGLAIGSLRCRKQLVYFRNAVLPPAKLLPLLFFRR